MRNGLSFEQAPPISVPYRFFLTAPIFGAAAGLMLAWLGPVTFQSRWTPGALALTHLIAAGFMLQAMCGALLQFVAVVAGANIWRPRPVAAVVHPLMTAGAMVLAAAFLFHWPPLFLLAVPLFTLGLGLFVAVMAIALLRTPARGVSIQVLRLALFGLLVTAVLGLVLALILGGQLSVPAAWSVLTLTPVHVGWGLVGWALLLVMGVSFLVVPMFQMTPAYPPWLTRLLPASLFVLLCLWSLQLLPTQDRPPPWSSGVLAIGLLLSGLYATVTLWLQARRRRRQIDVTLVFWRGAMLALLGLAGSGLLLPVLPSVIDPARAPLWLGVLALPGVFVSVIMGMLYKIMPFLNWLHLQRLDAMTAPIPNMQQMIPPRTMRAQMLAHFTALALLLAAVLRPALVMPAGLMFSISCLWLEWNLISATRVYVRCKNRIQAGA